MTLDTLKNRTEKKGCTLSEIIHKDHIIKPYVDIDRKVPHAVFHGRAARVAAAASGQQPI